MPAAARRRRPGAGNSRRRTSTTVQNRSVGLQQHGVEHRERHRPPWLNVAGGNDPIAFGYLEESYKSPPTSAPSPASRYRPSERVTPLKVDGGLKRTVAERPRAVE